MTAPEPSPPEDVAARVAVRHLRIGWWCLGVYLALGIALELLHATKAGLYLDVGNETRRLLFRLAHAHGTLIGLVNVAYGLTVKSSPRAASALASGGLLGGLVLVPLGFFLGALWARGGDPGLGAALVPAGALALVVGVVVIGAKVD
jgi:hypothetical protein